MAMLDKSQRLTKSLGLVSVYALATGATLSSGFFLLPGLAYAEAGPAVVLSYLLAAVPLIPATLSVVELATAMPRAGGAYYFLDRSMGPLVGTVGGVGTWFALSLKTAFALLGLGAYAKLFFADVPIKTLAVGMAIFFGLLNIVGSKASGSAQVVLVAGLLLVLVWFLGAGIPELHTEHFANFFAEGGHSIISTAGMVYISYVGVTKVASVAEEVSQPEKNLPRAVFLSVGTAILVYTLGTAVIVGLVPGDALSTDLTPVASAAKTMAGFPGVVVVSIAALLAFSSVANAGILAASRYPLAMSRDHLVPKWMGSLSGGGIPMVGVGLTVVLLIAFLVLLDPTALAKVASSFQLVMFSLVCLAVIIMRESHIGSYDPGYRTPFYPYTQLVGIAVPVYLVFQLGTMPLVLCFGLIAACIWWYFHYARPRAVRQGAVLHLFERWGRQRHHGLDAELRGIMREKGTREEDPYEDVIATAEVLDLEEQVNFEKLSLGVADVLADHIPDSPEDIAQRFVEGTRVGATPVAWGIALPHFRHPAIKRPLMVIVRSVQGIDVLPQDQSDQGAEAHDIHALFFLVSPEHNPGQHLRVLAQIANHVDDDDFLERFRDAQSEGEIKALLLQDRRVLTLMIEKDTPAGSFIGWPISELEMPPDCLIALIHRDGSTMIPRGRTVILEHDMLTVIGDESEIQTLQQMYGAPHQRDKT